MANSDSKQDANKKFVEDHKYTAIGLSLGLSFGALLGSLIDSLENGVSLGMIVGIIIGAQIDHRRRKKAEETK